MNSVPKELFRPIVGYDDIKELFKKSIVSEKPTHILLVGPPASAKTLFLLECSRLRDAEFVYGYKMTKAGLLRILFDMAPRILLIDEIEKADRDSLDILLGLMSEGLVKDVTAYSWREKKVNCRVYATANNAENLPPELLSRFHFKLELKAYTQKEYVQVASKVLMHLENVQVDLAEYIATKLADGTADIREAIGIARLAKSIEDVDNLLKLRKKYKLYHRLIY